MFLGVNFKLKLVVKKYLPLLLVIGMVVLGGCASKRYAKKGMKYQQAGLYELAADMFYQSMLKNPKNIDAAIGLKTNGQRLLDDKILAVHQAYSSGNDKETVYKFLETKAYRDKVNATGVMISYPQRTEDYFAEAKPRYLSKLYNEARILLDEENFSDAEKLFAEIKSIDPGYQGVDEHMKISKCEPLYREGSEFLTNGYFRKAYANFNSIIVNHGTYKDSKDLRDEALEKGMITIAIAPVKSKYRISSSLLSLLESKISRELTSLKNPFIKIVDIKNTEIFLDQQQQGSNVEVGQLLAAKALLSGKIISLTKVDGDLRKEEKRGYLKEEYSVKDKATAETRKEYRYHKVIYYEYIQENSVDVSFQYQLSSTETSSVLISDVINSGEDDKIHYATFEGKSENLIPGYWEFKQKDSPRDKKNESPSAVKELQSLFKASKNVETVEKLQDKVFDEIASNVALKINNYNPENQ